MQELGNQGKLKKKIMLKTFSGKLSLVFIIVFFVLIGFFFLFVALGERGGETYFSNLTLAIPFSLAVLSAIFSFFVGGFSL